MTDEQKKQLLHDCKVFESLTIKQIFTLMWWAVFSQQKIDVFYEKLEMGVMARYAFLYAKNLCNDRPNENQPNGKPTKEDQAVRRLAYILSVQAEIEGMKAQNSLNEYKNYPPRFNFEDFERKAVEIKQIATWKA